MKYLKAYFFGIALLFVFNAHGQDIHFSQFYASPLNLNPALTGSINGKARVIANYRNQWPQILQNDSYRTIALSLDYRKKLKSDDYFGIGISAFSDVAGSVRFGTNQAALSISFAKIISKSSSASHAIIGGLQSGIGQRKIDVSNLMWGSQHDGMGGFDPSLPGGIVEQTDFLFLDINSGLVWLSRFGERKSFYAGISAFHMNQPNVSFFTNSVQPYPIKTCFHGGAELPLSSQLSLLPSFMYLTQGIHAQLNFGATVSAKILADSLFSNVQAGIYYRIGQNEFGGLHSDAIISVVSIIVQDIQLNFSYDFTISELNYDTLGAVEVSLGYIFKAGDKNTTPFALP